MSLRDAKRLLQWKVVTEALAAAEVDAETMAMVEQAKHITDVVHGMAQTLVGAADVKQAKNYIKVEMVGLIPPFDRAYVELVRPGGKTSHELRELLRDRLQHVRSCLQQKQIELDAFREGITKGIDEDLAKEKYNTGEGCLTAAQVKWWSRWKGPAPKIVRSAAEALEAIGAKR